MGPLLRVAAVDLREAGIANGAMEARWLLASALEVDASALLTVVDVDERTATKFRALVERRCRREPLQHLLGRAAFRHLDLLVGPGVFVPRPETEHLVDLVLGGIADHDGPVVVDLCSGSGALGLAIAFERADATVALVERSAAALTWLRRNLAEQPDPVRARVQVVAVDIADPTAAAVITAVVGVADAVVANPPYVPTTAPVGPEVEHDPVDAVFGGVDGLELFPALTGLAATLLKAGALFATEHDESHQAELVTLLRASGVWSQIATHADLTGRARFVTALRSPAIDTRDTGTAESDR
ncbi:MAG: peptide chain release factor N(5)-glutamine methyltransferase [Janthinobacterium lividum]